MSEEIPSRIVSMATMKCPNCHKGNMFTNKSVFPLGQMLDMPEKCPVCGQKYEIEIGFWYGTGYVSYAISVGMIGVLAVLYATIVGFSWADNSIFKFLGGNDNYSSGIATYDNAILKSFISLCFCQIWQRGINERIE